MKTNVKELVIGSIIAMSVVGVLLSVCLGFMLSIVLLIGLHFTVKQTALLLLELIICILLVCNVCGLAFVGLFITNPTLWSNVNKSRHEDTMPFVKLLPDVYNHMEVYKRFYKVVSGELSDEQSGENQKKA